MLTLYSNYLLDSPVTSVTALDASEFTSAEPDLTIELIKCFRTADASSNATESAGDMQLPQAVDLICCSPHISWSIGEVFTVNHKHCQANGDLNFVRCHKYDKLQLDLYIEDHLACVHDIL